MKQTSELFSDQCQMYWDSHSIIEPMQQQEQFIYLLSKTLSINKLQEHGENGSKISRIEETCQNTSEQDGHGHGDYFITKLREIVCIFLSYLI